MNVSDLENSIVFEDASLIVLNKPAGWVVNRSNTYPDVTIQDWMEERLKISNTELLESGQDQVEIDDEGETENQYGTPDEIFAQRAGIVHRLDKDTSGILLLAKNKEVLVDLLAQFKERRVSKTYTALVHGKLTPLEGIIQLPIKRSSMDRLRFSVSVSGKASETHYKVNEYFPQLPKGIMPKKGKSYQGFSLVTLTPKTGRTHQIRVHMAAVHHPLVGDQVYAGYKRISVDQEWCKRQFLHATSITFTHPASKELNTFEAPLADDLVSVLGLFEENPLD